MTGYCLLIVGGKSTPAVRIVFKSTLPEALKAIKEIKAETEGRIDVLKMVNGDTKLVREDLNNEYSEE